MLRVSRIAALIGMGNPLGRALVRCNVTGPCKRATPWVTGGRQITVSFQQD